MKLTYIRLLNIFALGILIFTSFRFSTVTFPDENILIMPAPYAFLIWFLIYLSLLIWIVKPYSFTEEITVKKIGYWLAVTLLFSSTALMVGEPFSILFIVASLIVLIYIYKILPESSNKDSFLFRLPLSLYMSWMCIATIIDTAVVLKSLGITSIFGIPEGTITIVILIIGSLIGSILGAVTKDYLIPAVFLWGYVAIALHNRQIENIEITCMFGIAMLGFCLFSLLRQFENV